MMMDFVTTGDGCRIAYRFDGPAGAPVLLLSNSLGTAMDMWVPQMPFLTQHFRVLRYDSRGHGLSDAPNGAYSLDRLGRDVIELIDALSIPSIAFCGLSKGGMVGQWLGVRAPERIQRLVLANTSPYMGPPSGWDGRIAAVRKGGLAAIADAVLERWFTSSFRATEAIAPARAMLKTINPEGYVGCCAAIRDMDMRPLLGLIAIPALVIGGSEDTATPPDHTYTLVNGIANAKCVMLTAAHLSNLEQPEAFANALLDHLKS
ncbi:3-oxoadipate enol-lactonase [Beijerinckia mobilis]|uniref:3-oxoadipate enol-lactonase n=1 Tax=Beijerinckia mobilis TaxID=231434 RepID=UPI001FD996A8|nr:3-oxoadipate enol-lactonase [Beijerinckia mobilis]